MKNDTKSLSKLGETAVIRDILESLADAPGVVVPPGDDCAAVRPDPDCDLVLTSDPVIEGVHFEKGTPAGKVGHKAAGRVLSDLAAMGAQPRWILLNIAVPPDQPAAYVHDIISAAQALSLDFGAGIVGGDVSRADCVSVNAFACGLLPSGTALRRAGAKSGESIFVTGELGGSMSGKHLEFVPRVKEGIWLREHGYPSAMIDTSDGPATDLRHVIDASGTGARILPHCLPCSQHVAHLDEHERAMHALCDGEDFELLFTVPARRASELESSWKKHFTTRLSRIGTITGQTGEILLASPDGKETRLSARGFDHFG